jgi:hypothetical protein
LPRWVIARRRTRAVTPPPPARIEFAKHNFFYCHNFLPLYLQKILNNPDIWIYYSAGSARENPLRKGRFFGPRLPVRAALKTRKIFTKIRRKSGKGGFADTGRFQKCP